MFFENCSQDLLIINGSIYHLESQENLILDGLLVHCEDDLIALNLHLLKINRY